MLRELLRVSAALAGAAVSPAGSARLRTALEQALAVAAGDAAQLRRVEEALVQGYLFLGFPAALNGLALWRDVSGAPAPPGVRDDPLSRDRRGEEVCGRVYGDQIAALRRNIAALHPDLDRWMVEEGYGKVLGRDGLGLRERELCIVAILAVLGTPVQLYSHLRGSVRVGAEPAEVELALRAAEAEASELEGGEVRVTRAWEAWRRISDRGEG